VIPQDVKIYWHAQEWLIFHFSLPTIAVGIVILAVRTWLEHRADMNVNDDTPLKPKRMLDL
jgi:hypothetical protein